MSNKKVKSGQGDLSVKNCMNCYHFVDQMEGRIEKEGGHDLCINYALTKVGLQRY